MEPYWDQIKEIVRESDIVLEILDARAVEFSKNEQIDKIIKEYNRPRIFVVNKADLISKEELQNALEILKREHGASEDYIVYFSNKIKKTTRNLIGKIRQLFHKHGKRPTFKDNPILKRPYREAKADIIIGVVGYPNVGKSSVINAISFSKKAKVSSKAGTTHGVHWITAGGAKEIKLIDTPGVIPLARVDESKLGFFAARSTEKLKEPDVVAGDIIEHFINEKKLDIIENFYNFKISEENKDNPYLILEQLSLAKKHLKKGGVADDRRTAIMLVKAWQNGKLKL
jgi:ribosome biogenesis GTPase A